MRHVLRFFEIFFCCFVHDDKLRDKFWEKVLMEKKYYKCISGHFQFTLTTFFFNTFNDTILDNFIFYFLFFNRLARGDTLLVTFMMCVCAYSCRTAFKNSQRGYYVVYFYCVSLYHTSFKNIYFLWFSFQIKFTWGK